MTLTIYDKADLLEIPFKAAKVLKSENIIYIGDLVQKTSLEFLRTPYAGVVTLDTIEKALRPHDLYLGMDLPNWPPENFEEAAAAACGA